MTSAMTSAMTSLTFRVPFTALCSDNRKYLGGGTFVLSPEYRAAKGLPMRWDYRTLTLLPRPMTLGESDKAVTKGRKKG